MGQAPVSNKISSSKCLKKSLETHPSEAVQYDEVSIIITVVVPNKTDAAETSYYSYILYSYYTILGHTESWIYENPLMSCQSGWMFKDPILHIGEYIFEGLLHCHLRYHHHHLEVSFSNNNASITRKFCLVAIRHFNFVYPWECWNEFLVNGRPSWRPTSLD